ncbi:MAG TPA: ubiquitin-like domain-containing protein, partial [Nitrososphaera sp.]|nr:ubiquitin-like domain-containing protein [Nitrososphaera sp.]
GGKPQLKTTDTHVVIINHDDTEQSLPTRAKTVGEVLERASIKLNEGDIVEPGTDTEVVSDNFRINVYRAVPVTIVDRGKKTFAYSAAKTPRSIVKQAGIEVYPEDRLDLLPVDNFLVEASIGQRLVVKRATAVNLNLYGTQLNLRTQATTVKELLEEKNIKLSKGDTVQPELNSSLKANSQVFVLREGIKIEFAEEEIAMPRQIIEDTSLSFGTVVTRQQGAAGRRLVTYQVDTKTGERKKIQEVTVVDAVPLIVARGKAVQIPSDKQAVMAAAGIAASDFPYVDFIMSHESGWCPTKLQGQIGYCPPYAPEVIPTNKGYGLGQATPGTKMASFGSDWKTSAVTQLKWAASYTKGRYGTWEAAYNFWQDRHYW